MTPESTGNLPSPQSSIKILFYKAQMIEFIYLFKIVGIYWIFGE